MYIRPTETQDNVFVENVLGVGSDSREHMLSPLSLRHLFRGTKIGKSQMFIDYR